MNVDNDYRSNPKIMRCLGHKIDIENTSTILCYEFNKDWIHDKNFLNNSKSCYKNVCVCQWFMVSEPKQEIFLKMFMYCMSIIDDLININKNNRSYFDDVLNGCGPVAFTRIVIDNLSDKVVILPSDFFCTGAGCGSVPDTKNKFVKHHYTASWLK
jgi:hypothetical protein